MTLCRWQNRPETSAVPFLCDYCYREIDFPGEYMIWTGQKFHVGCYCAQMAIAHNGHGEEPKR